MDNFGQKFGNIFIGFLMMFFVMAMIMLFTGCEITLKTEEADVPTDSSEVQEDSVATADYFNAEDWIMFSPF